MKKSLITMALVLLAVAAQAQIKLHSNGQVSLQSTTTSYGIQIPTTGALSVEPNITIAYGQVSQTKARHQLTKAWTVKPLFEPLFPSSNSFYVLGNGNVFAYGSYLTYSPIDEGKKSIHPIERASELISEMKGYYFDSNEFEGIAPEELEGNENISPEALEGLLKDLVKDQMIGMSAEELEEVMPEAVRHDPDGGMAINYNAIVPVLIEAFKEQQARINQLEAILEENGLMRK